MLNKLRELFKPQIKYRIVEIKTPRTPFRGWDQNTKDAVATLASHPGFVALMDKLNFTKSALESQNNTRYKKDLREADFLQAGIFWSGWLQETVDKATQRGSQRSVVDPLEEELQAFKELDANIERICVDQRHASSE